MFNQHGLAVNEKPSVVGCWPVFAHANVTDIGAAPEAHKVGVHLPGE
jgi:hypothetical protein